MKMVQKSLYAQIKDASGNMHIISKNEEFAYQDYVMNLLEGEETVYKKKKLHGCKKWRLIIIHGLSM